MQVQVAGRGDSTHNAVVIQSLFRETTRNGKHTIRLVLLALTRNLLMIASSHSFGTSSTRPTENGQNIVEIRSLHPLETLKLTIFKKSVRQTLKLCFHNKYNRYFELEKSCGSNELWAVWCMNVLQIEERHHVTKKTSKKSLDKSTSYNLSNWSTFDEQWESHRVTWNDKHLYLGSKREVEDSSRPVPIRGLGPPEDIKLLYLKPQYFGCWDQTEHWVQCESSKLLKY